MKKSQKKTVIQQESVRTAQFTVLDILGISVSTLLFTLVWVGVFSVFLPERSELVLSDGLRKLAASDESERSLQDAVVEEGRRLHSYVKQTSLQILNTTLSVVQTGGSMQEIVDLTRVHARDVFCTVSYCLDSHAVSVAGHSADLGLSLSEKVLGSTAEYLNTVTFGLLSKADTTLYTKVTPVRVVHKNGSVYHCSGSLCMIQG